MNVFEEAVVYSTVMHAGATRKASNVPYILHPLEVAQIISTMTDDVEVMAAGVLHDVVEDTDGTLKEINRRFGERIAELVDSETEEKYPDQPAALTWRRRKEESLKKLKNASDKGTEILWLADKLANIRSLAQLYGERGTAAWQIFNQKDPEQVKWYYQSVAEEVELDLNRTGAYKEFINHINYIWPNTFAEEKTKYKKYRQISIAGCPMIGKGAKSKVYRYNDELIVKVYNANNKFKEIERENELARKALIAGIPTAISFGIVLVGEQYGSLFELIDSNSIANLIASDNSQVNYYADAMADLALQIHSTNGRAIGLPEYWPEVYQWIQGGIAHVDTDLTKQITAMVDAIPRVDTIIHGDFHDGNVMKQKDEYLLIDMDRLSICHPIVELCGIYMFCVGFGEISEDVVWKFKGYPYSVSKAFYWEFLKHYLKTEDSARLREVSDKAALLCYVRLVRRCYKKGTNLSHENQIACDYYMKQIRRLLETVDSFDF